MPNVEPARSMGGEGSVVWAGEEFGMGGGGVWYRRGGEFGIGGKGRSVNVITGPLISLSKVT